MCNLYNKCLKNLIKKIQLKVLMNHLKKYYITMKEMYLICMIQI